MPIGKNKPGLQLKLMLMLVIWIFKMWKNKSQYLPDKLYLQDDSLMPSAFSTIPEKKQQKTTEYRDFHVINGIYGIYGISCNTLIQL